MLLFYAMSVPTLPMPASLTGSQLSSQAAQSGRISPKERREILDLYREGSAGYTYFEG